MRKILMTVAMIATVALQAQTFKELIDKHNDMNATSLVLEAGEDTADYVLTFDAKEGDIAGTHIEYYFNKKATLYGDKTDWNWSGTSIKYGRWELTNIMKKYDDDEYYTRITDKAIPENTIHWTSPSGEGYVVLEWKEIEGVFSIEQRHLIDHYWFNEPEVPFEYNYKSKEVKTDEPITMVEDIEVEDDFDDVAVPFGVIEDVPLFPGCERVATSGRRLCFQEQMNKHIRTTFLYPKEAQTNEIQGRVYVNFIIEKDGSIGHIRARGPHKILEDAATQIILKLPRMTPGKIDGKAVRVPFSIPITYRLN